MKFYINSIVIAAYFSTTAAFMPLTSKPQLSSTTKLFQSKETETAPTLTTTKPTGTSFLPEETIERCKSGSPIEKAKLEKDPINSWIDVYEYARKIREGEMTWEEVEKADLDTVSE